jgi:hypothetical protein
MSELLIPNREVLDVTLSTFLNTGSSLPLAEISVAGSRLRQRPLMELSSSRLPAEVVLVRISLEVIPLFEVM